MNDWRVITNEDFPKNIKLLQIVPFDFWREAYLVKNSFYTKLLKESEEFVEQSGRGKDYLSGESVLKFWHRHCDFCTEKIDADTKATVYCTKNYENWICAKCFFDFKEQFTWKV
jgi:hypothetical protein